MKLCAAECATLIGRHQAEIWRYLLALGCPRADAEDVVQEAFLSLFRSDFEVRGEGETRSWLRLAARNLFFDICRRRKREAFVDLADAVEAAWEAEVGDDGGEARVKILRQCLEKLAGRAREAVLMRYSKDLTYGECGKALGLDEEAAKSLIRRAREKLRECVAHHLGSAQ